MSIQREGRKIRIPEIRTSWEDKGTSEVAAGKLEVMEKFFTPLPHSSSQRPSKSTHKDKSNWKGARNHYYKESMSSSSPSTSSSPWSSESNFRVHAQFPGYNSCAPHSRSCNDLSLGKGRRNEEKRNFPIKQNASHAKKPDQDGINMFSPVRSRAGSAKKGQSGDSKEAGPSNKNVREDKRVLKNGGRRAKSMEALAEKETRKKEGKSKKRVTEEKQRFSRFLDEITIQVLSPSNLNSLGVKERQNLNHRDQWKNSSTDSLGSRGKRSQHNSVAEHQEVRKKGKGKMGFASKAKMSADTPESWRRRDKSTSPDSVTSSARLRGEREDTNLSPSNMGHQPRRTNRRLSLEKAGKAMEHIERDTHDGPLSGVAKGKIQYTEKVHNSNLTLESATKEPIIPPPAWWGNSGSPTPSQHSEKNMENIADSSRRIKDKFPGTQPSSQNHEANLNCFIPSENLEQDKDSLNQKITDLLDHLVRAQSTICALEKLNVASILRYLPADVLDTMKVPHQGPDGSIQRECIKCQPSSSTINSQMSNLAISSGNLKYVKEQNTVESQSAPTVTAFTSWSLKREKSFSALHTLYTSTESECSLEDTTPICKLLSPHFPNLGESFSDDWKDDKTTDGCDSRSEQKNTEASKSSSPLLSLLPAHRTPQHNHHLRASSTESSGDDPLINWTDAPSYEPPLDHHSAQKILDTLLGLKTDTNIAKPENAGGFSSVNASKIDGHLIRSENKYSDNPKSVVSRIDAKHMSQSGVNKDSLHTSGQGFQHDSILCSTHSLLPSPAGDSAHRLLPAGSKLPPLPVKRTSVPGSYVNTYPALSSVGEVGFRPVGKGENLIHHKSDFLIPTCYSPSSMQSTDSLNQQLDPFALRSPSGNELGMGNWEDHSYQQEGQRERKPRKERTVTFSTMNSDSQSKQSLVTARSKYMSNRIADEGQEDSTSMDSTLL